MVKETVFENNGQAVHQIPDVGVINSRYVLELKGANQWLSLHAWPARLPPVETEPGWRRTWPSRSRGRPTVVSPEAESAAGRQSRLPRQSLAGDQPEPKDWTIKLVDEVPNTHGSPGPVGLLQRSRNLLRQHRCDAEQPQTASR